MITRHCGDHFKIYTYKCQALCCTSETNIMLYVNKGSESIFVRTKFESDSVLELFLKEKLGLTQFPVKSKR